MLLQKSKLFSKEYKETIQEALNVLGKKNLALILQGVSFPSENNENTGFGTYNSQGAKELFNYLQGVFSAVQLGPCGKTKLSDSSPYTGTVFSKNPLFINLKELTTSKWDKILSQKTLDKIIEMNPNKGTNRAAYVYASENIELAANEFYKNFKKNASKNLKKEFENFKKENAFWLDKDALYEALTIENKSDYWPQWNSELDRTLFGNADKKKAEKRIKDIEKKYQDTIEKYKLEQFIVQKQSNETLEYTKKLGLKLIADRQVAFSDRDNWAYQSMFLDGWCLGCPPDYFSEDGQAWGFSVVDPEKLFNKDGSLGEAGKFLKAKVQKALSDSKNIRIDHAMGLVNPYIYKADSVKYVQKEDENGNMVQYPDRKELESGYLSELGLDKNKNYQKILPKIVLPAMREMGVNPKDVVWEDLGYDPTGVFDKVFRQQEHLPGISGLIWTKGTEAKWDNWSYIGCHDNMPTEKMANGEDAKREPWSTGYLSSSLRSDPYKGAEREALKAKIKSSPKELAKAKFADLFHATKNIQISFMDFFGMNKSYNTPGTTGGDNWTLRLNPNYQDTYHQSLEDETYAMNLPEILQMAVQAKFDDNVSKNYKPYQEELRKVTPLMNKLKHYENVLKEEEK